MTYLTLANGRIEGRKQPVLCIDAGIGHGVHDSRLARIGIANQRYSNVIRTRFSLRLPLAIQLLQLIFELGNALVNQATIGFYLRLSGSSGTNPSLLAGKVRPKARQSRKLILQLGQLYLRFS